MCAGFRNFNMEVVPAILPQNFRELEDGLESVVHQARTVQIDLCDGKFTPGKTWPFDNLAGFEWQDILTEESGMPLWEYFDFELDLMINDIPQWWDDLVKIGPAGVVFHFPSGRAKIEELKEFIHTLDPYFKNQLRLGVAYEHDTDTNDILDIQDDITYVQCMGIEKVGVQGNPFDESVFERIAWVKNNLPQHEVGVDGAVSLENIQALKDAGVTRFVVGSAIFKADSPASAILDFKEALN